MSTCRHFIPALPLWQHVHDGWGDVIKSLRQKRSDATAADDNINERDGNLRSGILSKDISRAPSTVLQDKAAIDVLNYYLVYILGADEIDDIDMRIIETDIESFLTGFSYWLCNTNIPANHQKYLENPELIPTSLTAGSLKGYLGKVIQMLRKLFPNDEFWEEEDRVSNISGTKFEKACKRAQKKKDDSFGQESKIGLYRKARHESSLDDPNYLPHWTCLVNCDEICKVMLSKTKIDDIASRMTEKRLALTLTFHAVGRGGETKYLDWKNISFNHWMDCLEALWTELKTLSTYSCPFVPNKDGYLTDVLHASIQVVNSINQIGSSVTELLRENNVLKQQVLQGYAAAMAEREENRKEREAHRKEREAHRKEREESKKLRKDVSRLILFFNPQVLPQSPSTPGSAPQSPSSHLGKRKAPPEPLVAPAAAAAFESSNTVAPAASTNVASAATASAVDPADPASSDSSIQEMVTNYNHVDHNQEHGGTDLPDIISGAYASRCFRTEVSFTPAFMMRPARFKDPTKYNHCLELFNVVASPVDRAMLGRAGLTKLELSTAAHNIAEASMNHISALEGKPRSNRQRMGYAGVGARVAKVKNKNPNLRL